MNRYVALILAGVCMVVATNLWAQPHAQPTDELLVGGAWVFPTGSGNKVTFKNAGAYSITYRHYFLPNWALSSTATYNEQVVHNPWPYWGNPHRSLHFSDTNLLVIGEFHFLPSHVVDPYVGAGVCLLWNRGDSGAPIFVYNGRGNSGYVWQYPSSRGADLSFAATVGANWHFGKVLFLAWDIKYINSHIDTLQYGLNPAKEITHISYAPFLLTVNLGWRW